MSELPAEPYYKVRRRRLIAATAWALCGTFAVLAGVYGIGRLRSNPADAAAVTLAAKTLTTEVNSAILGVSLFNTGINQRATTRWIAAQESQYLISPTTVQNGMEIRAQSSTYASTFDANVGFLE